LLGNVIVLVPLILNGHSGTKYGIPFPVFVRSMFGIQGSKVAAMIRALIGIKSKVRDLFARMWMVWNSDVDWWRSYL
jgi:purine-cytosine permease-like protein